METNRAFYAGFVFLLLAVDCSFLNWKVNVIAKTDSEDPNDKQDPSEQTVGLNSVSDSNKEAQLIKSKENIDTSRKNKKNDDESGQSGSRKRGNVDKENGKSEEDPQVQNDNNKKKTSKPGENGNQGNSAVSAKDSHVKDCDPSNKCIDNENKFFACLRVPGNDPQYSLLIQNKEKKPLIVAISAPSFVQLEKSEIQLEAEGNQKVEVSISKSGTESLIVLKAGKGHCNLDINHLISENSNSEKSSYISFMSRTPTIIVISIAVFIVVAAGWAFASFRKRQVPAGGPKYRRLDEELPNSGGRNGEGENSEGWDNSWGDDWDDEEAPKTPPMPLTPSLSAKGLASRRLSKEGWKD